MYNKENRIRLRRGRSALIQAPLVYSDGSALELESGDVVRFAVRSGADGELLISKTMVQADGKASLELAPSDTSSLELGHYYYDIGIDFSDGTFYDLVEWTGFDLLPSAAQDGGA